MLGPSGCGKTTALRLIAGFDQPDEGIIRIGGQDMRGVPCEARQLGVVFQQYALWPHMTIEENVTFGLEMRKIPLQQRLERASAVLEIVRLTSAMHRYPHQLSGGQQQRVALARALALEPKLILFDEPLSNLDPALRHELRQEIRAIHREFRTTMIYVTHDQVEALSMAQRVGLISEGKVIETGPPASLYNNPASRFTASFLGDTNILTGVVEEESTLVLDGGVRVEIAPAIRSHGTFMIRPEHLRIVQRSGDLSVSGTVLSTLFLGSTTVLDFKLTNDMELRLLHLGTLEPIAPGAVIPVWYSPTDMIPLQD